MKVLIRIITNLLLSLDQMLNTVLLGHPDETLSSRLGRTVENERYFWVKWLRVLVDFIFFFDVKYTKDGVKLKHCQKSVMKLEQKNFRKFVNYEVWSWSKNSNYS